MNLKEFFFLVVFGTSVIGLTSGAAIPENSQPENAISVDNEFIGGSRDSLSFPPFPKLGMLPAEINNLMLDNNFGYVYEKPETPFEGYFYERPKVPMTLPTTSPSSTTETVSSKEEETIVDLPDGAARIL